MPPNEMPGESREKKETEAPEEGDFGQVGVPSHRFDPFIMQRSTIVTREKHTVMVLRMTLIVSVFSILLVSSIFPLLSSAYTLKSKKRCHPPTPLRNSVQSYGTPMGPSSLATYLFL
tara:strand:- start:10392 stop:10742 length:351 start_codon:yes stop_codon:yes gene_type:complete